METAVVPVGIEREYKNWNLITLFGAFPLHLYTYSS